MPARSRRLEPGIARTASGFSAYLRVHGRLLYKRFPPSATIDEMRSWRDRKRRELGGTKADRGTLAHDAMRYLAAVDAMISYVQREADINAWLAVFGHRSRAGLRPDEIRAQLHAWKTSGLAGSTVNHRRSALSHLYTVLDGKSAWNPLREIPPFKEPAPVARGVPMATVRRILRKMPRSATKARLTWLAWTGMRPSELTRLTPSDVDARRKLARVSTAKGGRPREIPLHRAARAAWREIVKRKALGPFSLASARHSLLLACQKANVTPIRIYDLRHSFLSAMRAGGADLADVQALAGHSSIRLTARYAPIVTRKLRQAVERIGR